MSLIVRSQISWLAVASVLAAGAVPLGAPKAHASSVQTYVDQALPVAGLPNASTTSEPLRPGDITMRDVLRTYARQKQHAPDSQQDKGAEQRAAQPPLLAPSSKRSTSGTMMMQGMRSVLQSTGSQVQTQELRSPAPQTSPPVPRVQSELGDLLGESSSGAKPSGGRLAESAQTSATKESARYQPGEEPRVLGQGFAPASPPNTVSTSSQPTPLAAGVQTSPQRCAGRATAWVKSCVDAGYPSTFVGEIRGETREGCPDGGLRDVWVSNTCSPSGEPLERGASSTVQDLRPYADEGRLRQPESGIGLTPSLDTPVSNVVTARCGPANGLASSRRPIADLCDSGVATEVSGDGPWRWSCKGARGGMTVSCAAPFARNEERDSLSTSRASGQTAKNASSWNQASGEISLKVLDGRCGSAADVGVNRAPSSHLCAQGLASRVSGEGPWSWACSGANGGTAAACFAPRISDGVCGSAHGASFGAIPMSGLCGSGYASAVTGEGPWYWTCSGLHGGEASTCSAMRVVNAVCGQASLEGHRKAPSERLCSVGQPSQVGGMGPWSWTCSGSHGGSEVSCSSPVIVDGVCGAANGGAYSSSPSENLCASGIPSRVSGDGPWTWNCGGAVGGESQSCVALRQIEKAAQASAMIVVPQGGVADSSQKALSLGQPQGILMPPSPSSVSGPSAFGLCGPAAELAALVAPDRELCARGAAGSVTGDGPWSWTCKDDKGISETCSTLSLAPPPQTLIGASAPPPDADSLAASVPDQDSGLSAISENFSDVPERKPRIPSEHAQAVALSGSKKGADSAPGTSALAVSDQPIALVAPSGKALSQNPAPSSQPLAFSPRKAACGAAAGQGFSQIPTSDLCADGSVPSLISGDGPWTWNCSPSDEKVVCTAFKLTNGVCGTASGAVMDRAPRENLCAEGIASELFGSGPWLWTCVGAGGGGSSSCSTAAIQQVRVDGVCGTASKSMLSGAPLDNLCDSGLAGPVYGDGPWTWTCSGMNGGVAAPCSASQSSAVAEMQHEAQRASVTRVDGYCGSANGMAFSEQPVESLCVSGQQTQVVGEGPWSWSCMGLNGGMSVSCTAPLLPPAPLDGVCGSASGSPALVIPQGGLCASGISSAVSGKGPWTWSCSGINGGAAVGCVAPFAGKSSGMASSAMPSLVVGNGQAQELSRDSAAASHSSSADVSSQANKTRLVTPSLKAERIPPRKPADIPSPHAQQFADLPRAPSGREREGLSAPTLPPLRSAESSVLGSPSLRETERKASESFSGGEMAIVPGNHFVLPDDVSLIAFVGKDGNLNDEAVKVLDRLASVLSANKGVRVTLTAYAGNKDISPRDARRLSLSRGLAVRDYLVSKGVAAGRMDVRALGSNVPSGDPDRVDIRAN